MSSLVQILLKILIYNSPIIWIQKVFLAWTTNFSKKEKQSHCYNLLTLMYMQNATSHFTKPNEIYDMTLALEE